MTELIKTEVMTSREIAEITGKEHKNVMRDIRNLLEAGVAALNFELGEYTDANGQKRPMYQLTKKGCLILASGYDPVLREKIINRWEELEKRARAEVPALPTYAEALRQLADKVEENERLALENKEMKPKALFADAVASSSRSCLVAELAKILKQNGIDTGQNRLFQWLRGHGYLGSKGDYYNQPTQTAMDMGLFEIKKRTIANPDGSVIVTSTTKVTPKGQIYFVNKFLA